MHRRNSRIVTIILTALVGGIVLWSFADAKEHEQTKKQVELVGRVVDLHRYLTRSALPGAQPQSESEPTTGVHTPIGLAIGHRGVPESNWIYLIVFDPGDNSQVEAYESARRLVGKRARVTGRLFKRNKLNGVRIEKVSQVRLVRQ